MPEPISEKEQTDRAASPAPTNVIRAPSTISATSSVHTTDYDSTDSLLDGFDTGSDEELWQASREQAATRPPQQQQPRQRPAGQVDPEYVVLYEDTSGDDGDW